VTAGSGEFAATAGRCEKTTRALGLGCRAQAEQEIHRSRCLSLGYIGAAQRQKARRKRDLGPTRLERSAACLEAICGIFQQWPSAFVLALRRGEHAVSALGEGAQRRSSDQVLDFAECLEARRRLIELPECDSRMDEQLECRSAAKVPVLGHLAQQSLEKLDGAERVAAVERQGGSAELCARPCTRLIEE
jgi:hypothetical protein